MLTVLWSLIIFFLALILAIIIILTVVFFIPVRLFINTWSRDFRITFAGGSAIYEVRNGIKGLQWRLFFFHGFIPLHVLFKKKEKKPGTGKPKKKKRKAEVSEKPERSQVQGLTFFRNVTALLKEEEELLKRVLRLIGRLLQEVRNCFLVRYIIGTFHVEDPYACGLYHAILAPQCRSNFCLLPNFTGDNFLQLRAEITPGYILSSILKFLISLPYIRMYRIYKRVKAW